MASVPGIENKYYRGFIEENCPSSVGKSDLHLPFFHSCSGGQFRQIIGSGQILATVCPEFSENLLYLFYGKPSYRVGNDNITRDLGYFPTSFVIKLSHSDSIKRIFPFDSGAFLNNILKDVCGEFPNKEDAKVDIEKYDLGSELDVLAKYINVIYGSDKDYFDIKPCLDRDSLQGMCFELSRLLEMAESHSTHDWDSRATTAEVQADNSIQLSGTTIEAVILPAQLISNDIDLQEFFYVNGIDVETYNASRIKPSSVTDLVTSVAQEYLVQKGLL